MDATLKALKKNGFHAEFFDTGREAADFVIKQAAECQTVGIAGTKTVRDLGLSEEPGTGRENRVRQLETQAGLAGRIGMPEA